MSDPKQRSVAVQDLVLLPNATTGLNVVIQGAGLQRGECSTVEAGMVCLMKALSPMAASVLWPGQDAGIVVLQPQQG
jgi:hypothetical protein